MGEVPDPQPGLDEIRVQVKTCAVCRTDLHLAEGDLAPKRFGVVPGHEIVGVVDRAGANCRRFHLGDRVGIAWLASTCGRCRFCIAGRENLCLDPRFTGWDQDGGYATYAVVKEAFAYALPPGFDDETAAPLLCAGIIGYRALKRSEVPPGGRLGLYGFGASAHLALQVALSTGSEVHVMTRSPKARQLALSLGASSARDLSKAPPVPLDASVVFAPAGSVVLSALEATERGGTVVVAGIHLSPIGNLDYDKHLFQERQVRSVTANTRQDGEEFLAIAQRIRLQLSTIPYRFGEADRALSDLAHGRVQGAAVVHISDGQI